MQRVSKTIFYASINPMQEVIDQMNTFTSFIQNQPCLSVDFINIAVRKILEITRQDIGNIRELVADMKKTFDSVFGDIVKPTIDLLKHFHNALAYLVVMFKHSCDEKDGLLGVHGVPITFDPKYLIQIKLLIPTLCGLLEKLSALMVPGNTTNIKETLRKHIPNQLWLNSNLTQNCDHLVFNETREYKALQELIDDTLVNWEKPNEGLSSGEEWSQALKSSVGARYHNTDFMIYCIRELRTVLEKGHKDVSNIYAEVDELAINIALFISPSFHESVEPELNWIKAKSNLLHKVLTEYSQNSISKHQILQNIREDKFKHNLQFTLDSMLSTMNTEIKIKCHIQTEKVKSNVHKWIQSLLKTTSSMAKYYEHDFIENKTRMMEIWKKPIPWLMCASETLHSQENETWPTWPSSLRLNDFVSQEAPIMIARILKYYVDGLYRIINDVQMRMWKVSEQVKVKFSAMQHKMDTFEKESDFGNDFFR